jgi:H+/Cl- antiporter ClcA
MVYSTDSNDLHSPQSSSHASQNKHLSEDSQPLFYCLVIIFHILLPGYNFSGYKFFKKNDFRGISDIEKGNTGKTAVFLLETTL